MCLVFLCDEEERKSWGGSKRRGVVRTMEENWKLWMFRVSGGSVSYPFASRLRENILAPCVPGVWSCVTSHFT
ncbi:hypothetical protein CRYUN_Cryun11dG0056700 [Craigia yunnanensis]